MNISIVGLKLKAAVALIAIITITRRKDKMLILNDEIIVLV